MSTDSSEHGCGCSCNVLLTLCLYWDISSTSSSTGGRHFLSQNSHVDRSLSDDDIDEIIELSCSDSGSETGVLADDFGSNSNDHLASSRDVCAWGELGQVNHLVLVESCGSRFESWYGLLCTWQRNTSWLVRLRKAHLKLHYLYQPPVIRRHRHVIWAL